MNLAIIHALHWKPAKSICASRNAGRSRRCPTMLSNSCASTRGRPFATAANLAAGTSADVDQPASPPCPRTKRPPLRRAPRAQRQSRQHANVDLSPSACGRLRLRGRCNGLRQGRRRQRQGPQRQGLQRQPGPRCHQCNWRWRKLLAAVDAGLATLSRLTRCATCGRRRSQQKGAGRLRAPLPHRRRIRSSKVRNIFPIAAPCACRANCQRPCRRERTLRRPSG